MSDEANVALYLIRAPKLDRTMNLRKILNLEASRQVSHSKLEQNLPLYPRLEYRPKRALISRAKAKRTTNKVNSQGDLDA